MLTRLTTQYEILLIHIHFIYLKTVLLKLNIKSGNKALTIHHTVFSLTFITFLAGDPRCPVSMYLMYAAKRPEKLQILCWYQQ